MLCQPLLTETKKTTQIDYDKGTTDVEATFTTRAKHAHLPGFGIHSKGAWRAFPRVFGHAHFDKVAG